MYRVVLYQNKDGKSPISEFIYSSNQSLQNKIARQIGYLSEYGLTFANKNLRKLTGTKLWEIRILGRDSVRIICVAIIDKEVFILHIFKKKTNKTSSKDLNISLNRYKEVLDK